MARKSGAPIPVTMAWRPSRRRMFRGGRTRSWSVWPTRRRRPTVAPRRRLPLRAHRLRRRLVRPLLLHAHRRLRRARHPRLRATRRLRRALLRLRASRRLPRPASRRSTSRRRLAATMTRTTRTRTKIRTRRGAIAAAPARWPAGTPVVTTRAVPAAPLRRRATRLRRLAHLRPAVVVPVTTPARRA